MTSKNETGYWILTKGRSKFVDTAPERFVEEILKELGIAYKHPSPGNPDGCIPHVGKDDLTIWPDFNLGDCCVIEVDGIHHDTPKQESKTRWRDGLLNSIGIKVIHIDAKLCNLQWRDYVMRKLRIALAGSERVYHLYA